MTFISFALDATSAALLGMTGFVEAGSAPATHLTIGLASAIASGLFAAYALVQRD